MNFLCWAPGPYENKGDASILISVIHAFSTHFGSTMIDITGSIYGYLHANRENALKSEGIRFVEFPSFVVLGGIKRFLFRRGCQQINHIDRTARAKRKGKPKSRNSRAFRCYLLLLDILLTTYLPPKIFKKYFLFQFKERGIDLLSYKAIVTAGGTQLEDKEYAGYPGFAHNLSILGAAVAAHIPFFITGQSIGPIRSKFGRFVTRHILNRAGGICLREGLSQRYVLENLKVKRQTRLGSDWAFLLPTISDKDAKQLIQKYFAYPDRQKIAIIPRKIVSSTGNPYLNLKELAKVADRLIQMENTEVILFPQTIASATLLHDDLQTCFQIQKIMTNKIEVIDTRNWTVGEIAGFLGAVDLLVTFRMHAIIMAAAAGGTPAIAISHIHKFEGVMELLGIKELVVSHDKCTSEIILEKVRYAFDNQGKILSELECGIVKAKRLAVENSEMVRGYFYEGSKQG